MSLQNALEALKRKDFSAALKEMASEDVVSYTIQHFQIKGLAELCLKDWKAALKTFESSTDRFPDNALFWFNRGIAEENLRLFKRAILSQECAIALDPNLSEAYGNLSNLYRGQKRFEDAEAMAREALAHNANKGEALNCLGLALTKQRKYAEARDIYHKAHVAAPQLAVVLANEANLETDCLNFEASFKLFAQARALSDEAIFRHDEGLARLLAGDHKKGWELYETRLSLPSSLRIHPSCPRWQGEGLKGKTLLILAEQGFGDAIQFSRYQDLITDGELIWSVPKNLVRLLSSNVRGQVLAETSPLPKTDYYCPLFSLPLATRHTEPYPLKQLFKTPEEPRLPQGSHKIKIGLVWTGSPTNERDYERSIPLNLLAPLLEALSADYYAPFVDASPQDIGSLPITALQSLITDFADTAALLKQLDLLITVDTAVAHLAGSLGIKTYLLLPYCPDWRWGTKGETTPWYSSLTLVRQTKSGDWQSVLNKLAELLKRGF